MVNMGVANIWRVSLLFCSVFNHQHLDFCHLLRMNLLMIGFRSVYGIFVLNMSARSAFLAALSDLSYPCISM